MRNQLCAVEWRTAGDGGDSIDHPPGQRHDFTNAASGALTLQEFKLSRSVPPVVTLTAITYLSQLKAREALREPLDVHLTAQCLTVSVEMV